MKKILTGVSMCLLAIVVGFSFSACKKKPKLEGTYSFNEAKFFGFTGNRKNIAEWLESGDEGMLGGADTEGLKRVFDYITNMEVTLNTDGSAKIIIRDFVGVAADIKWSIGNFNEYDDIELALDYFTELGIIQDGDVVLKTTYTNTDGVIAFGKVFVGEIDDLREAVEHDDQVDGWIKAGLGEDGMMPIEEFITIFLGGWYTDSSVRYYAYDENGAVELTADEIKKIEEKYDCTDLHFEWKGSGWYWDGVDGAYYDYNCYVGYWEGWQGLSMASLTGSFVGGELILDVTIESAGYMELHEKETFGVTVNGGSYYGLDTVIPIKVTLKK